MEIKDKCGMIMIPVRSGHMEYADDDIQIEARVLTDDGIRVIIKWNIKKGGNNEKGTGLQKSKESKGSGKA